jgi:hypothetical protein
MSKDIPIEFAREPRSLSERARWKATEWRQLLLYTGPIVLKGIISRPMYDNFLLFSVAISILADPVLSVSSADYAEELLQTFVKHFGRLYGESKIVYNVHNLIHLPDDVRVHGHLDSFSAFPFENFLGSLKVLVRKKHQLLEQVVRRIDERNSLLLERHPLTNFKRNDQVLDLKMEHFNGPFSSPHGPRYRPIRQYKQLSCKFHGVRITVKITKGDNCVNIDGKICLIDNIFSAGSNVFFVFRVYTKVEPFFLYPCSSEKIDVHKVSLISSDRFECDYRDMKGKYVLFPLDTERTMVAKRLLHT